MQSKQGEEIFANLQISVIDTGEGMTEEGVSKLFIDFNRLDENAHRNRKGTGLGLSICKKIIEKMGGSVRVESKIGEGSKFIFNLKTKCMKKPISYNHKELPTVFIQKGCDQLELCVAHKRFKPRMDCQAYQEKEPSVFLTKLLQLAELPLGSPMVFQRNNMLPESLDFEIEESKVEIDVQDNVNS